MQTTLDLLEVALKTRNASEWATHLKLAKSALRTARTRGHLSPAIAGALAEELGQDVDRWIAIAALESEKDSACKTRMLKRYAKELKVRSILIMRSLADTFARLAAPRARAA